MTYLDQKIMFTIMSSEFLGQSWLKGEKNELSPHIVIMTKRFNDVSYLSENYVKLNRKKIVLCAFFFRCLDWQCRKFSPNLALIQEFKPQKNGPQWPIFADACTILTAFCKFVPHLITAPFFVSKTLGQECPNR